MSMAVAQDQPDAEYVASTVVLLYAWRVTFPQRLAATGISLFALMWAFASPNGLIGFGIAVAAWVVLLNYHRQTNRVAEVLTPIVAPYALGVSPKTAMELIPVLAQRTPKAWLAAPDDATRRRWFNEAVRATFAPPEGQVNCGTGHYPGCPHRRPKQWNDLFADPDSTQP